MHPQRPSAAPDQGYAARLPSWDALLGTLLYAAVVAFLATRHELWRDEGRALNIAANSHSLQELLHNLRNDGHPVLWYLILYVGFHATGSMLVLKPLSVTIAAGAMYLWLRWSPWPRWQKALFAAGIFPLYEYSVMCRNYGISMLLLFGVAVLHRGRFRRPIPLAITLALLANTNAYALIIVLALVAGLALERWLEPPPRPCSWAQTVTAALLVAAGIACSVLVMYPDSSTSATSMHTLAPRVVVGSFVAAVLCPGHIFFPGLLEYPPGLTPYLSLGAHLLGGVLSLAATAALWFVAASLRARSWLTATLLAAVVGFSLNSDLVYRSALRHWGLLYILVLVLLWIQRDAEIDGGGLALRPRAARWTLPVLLWAQVGLSVLPVGSDLFGAFSSSASFGAYLNQRPELRNAIIVGEPDWLFEALPYYAPNPIYQPREGRYLLKVNFTSASQPVLTLTDLMRSATRLRSETGRPVIIALGFELTPQGPFTLKAGYANTFTYSPESLHDFSLQAERLVRFDGAANDENYTIYRWKGLSD